MKAAIFRARVAWVAILGLCGLTTPALRAQAAVLEVDASGGAPFTTIQDAIDASANGDTILVHGGAYAVFTVVHRSLTIAAVEGERVSCTPDPLATAIPPWSAVQSFGPDDRVVLRGLSFAGLKIITFDGSVWIEDCVISDMAPAALMVQFSPDVVLLRCTITGPSQTPVDPTGFFSPDAGSGLLCSLSTVAIFDCTIVGGNGSDGVQTPFGLVPPTAGSDAVLVGGGDVWLSGCTAQGGFGGAGPIAGLCLDGQPGGHGVHADGYSPVVHVLDCTLVGGAGGAKAPSCSSGSSQAGAPGQPSFATTGVIVPVAGTARHLQISGPTPEHDVVHVSAAGVPGDIVLLLVASQQELVIPPGGPGALLLPTHFTILPLGTLGDPAEIDLPFMLPELGPGLQALNVFAQGAYLPLSGGTRLGAGSVFIALDESF